MICDLKMNNGHVTMDDITEKAPALIRCLTTWLQLLIYRVSRRSLPVIYFHLRNLQARYGIIKFMV